MPRQDEVDVVTTVVEGVALGPEVFLRCEKQGADGGLHGFVDLHGDDQLRSEVGVFKDVDPVVHIVASMPEEPLLGQLVQRLRRPAQIGRERCTKRMGRDLADRAVLLLDRDEGSLEVGGVAVSTRAVAMPTSGDEPGLAIDHTGLRVGVEGFDQDPKQHHKVLGNDQHPLGHLVLQPDLVGARYGAPVLVADTERASSLLVDGEDAVGPGVR